MPGWNPDALVTRQVAPPAMLSDVNESSDAWSSAAAKHEQKRWAEQSELALQNDAAFKRHQSNVERALVRFDSVSEWADFISFLTRLLKALQGAPKFNAIPHKLIVAKRLSQCLNPALPTGVHARTLDVYSHIFTVIGVEGLRRDLQVWSPGLFPFFQNAATSVRPALLDLFERCYLPLGSDLRPVTRALLLSLLPGLEEESSEFFDRVVRLLDRIAGSVTTEFFLQNIWLVLISSRPIRLSALNYLGRRMPKVRGAKALDADQSVEAGDVSTDHLDNSVPLTALRPALLVRGLAQTLRDDSLLVRRNALDFLVTHLPLASQAFSEIQVHDRILLMDAAIGSVLRRDISLNRRLYAWLLGRSDSEGQQQAYFDQHALSLVTDALRLDMKQASSESSARQRPYKILVSLMDKVAIGQPLLRTLVLEAFHTLVHNTGLNENSDLFPTAQMLLESLDSFLLYQHLFWALRDECNEPEKSARFGSATQLFHEMLDVFLHHDEETLSIHLPILYLALIHLMQTILETPQPQPQRILRMLDLLEKIQERLPPRVYILHQAQTGKPLGYAAKSLYTDGESPERLATLQDPEQCAQLIDTLFRIGLCLVPHTAWMPDQRHAVSTKCFRLLRTTIERLDAARDLSNTGSDTHPDAEQMIRFAADTWDAQAFAYLAQSLPFETYCSLLHAMLDLSQCNYIQGTFGFAEFEHFASVLVPLLAYLQPGQLRCHAPAATLFWSLKRMSSSDYATSILCTRIQEPDARPAALQALGTLWRHGAPLGYAQELIGPIFLVLDQLRAPHVQERSSSARWLCTYLETFDTVLELVLSHLLALSSERAPRTIATAEQSVQAYEYTEPFDQDLLNYYLATLASLLQLGGKCLVQSAKETQRDDMSALDALTSHMILLLRSAAPPNDWLAPGNETTHALCLDILQCMLHHNAQDRAWCADVQHHMVDTLLIALSRRDGTTQMGVLSTLLSAIKIRFDALDTDTAVLLLELIRRGLRESPNGATFSSWIEFVLNVLPLSKDTDNELLLPFCVSASELFTNAVEQLTYDEGHADWRQAFLPARTAIAARLPASELEINQLIRTVEFALQQASSQAHLSDSERLADTELATTTGFLGNLSSVFTGESESVSSRGSVPPMLRVLSQVVHALEYAWVMAKGSQQTLLPNVYQQSTDTLERFYRQHTASVVEAVVENWWFRSFQNSDGLHTRTVDHETISLLDCLSSSPQVLVSSLSDAIVLRIAPSADRKKASGRTLIGELVVFRFLEKYIAQLETFDVVQVWPLLSVLAKNISSNHVANKALIYYTLRLVTTAGEPLSKSSIFEDRRARRDLQETFVRLIEQLVSLYARTLDISVNRRIKDSDTPTGADTPEEANTVASDAAAAPPPAQVVAYLSSAVVPALETLAIETDKSVALCTTLVYYILAPAFRARGRTMDIDPLVLEMLSRMCRIPGTVKTWRTLVMDTFMDAKFFSIPPAAAKKWTGMVAALYSAERERFVDVIGRISNTPTNNLFTSRETDLLARTVSIRRLSYSIYAGCPNAFLTQLPLIQEKVVDILRSNAPELVQAEIYLCMRVLLCRFASQHLAGFWPIILTELLRFFGRVKSELPKDHTDTMQLLFGTLKLVDYLLTLQTEDFQVHQWLLITDTPDALEPSSEWLPDSLLDGIGRLAVEHLGEPTYNTHQEYAGQPRKPMLRKTRADTMRSLRPFLVCVSRMSFLEVNECNGIDWDAIDEDLLSDLLEPVVIKS